MYSGLYLPEGWLIHTEKNRKMTQSPEELIKAMEAQEVLEGRALMCDAERNLIVDINGVLGIIPRDEAAIGLKEGLTREIAVISRVGKPVAFVITGADFKNESKIKLRLSRKRAQQKAMAHFMETLVPGDVMQGRVTHLEPFGAFVDIGCGNAALIGIENLSVSRIKHPGNRLCVGQDIFAAVLHMDYENARINLTQRELLGTWEENAARFAVGQTVRGIVRGIEDYGVFIELTPNLSGLAESVLNVEMGDNVSVFIKRITPEKMKIKLIVIDKLEKNEEARIGADDYFISSGHIEKWQYSPEACERKKIITEFS